MKKNRGRACHLLTVKFRDMNKDLQNPSPSEPTPNDKKTQKSHATTLYSDEEQDEDPLIYQHLGVAIFGMII